MRISNYLRYKLNLASHYSHNETTILMKVSVIFRHVETRKRRSTELVVLEGNSSFNGSN